MALAASAIAAVAMALTCSLRSARFQRYRQLDQRVAALLEAAQFQRANRLVQQALNSYRDADRIPPAVYAAAALVLAQRADSQRLDRALACLDAAFDTGFSPAERPDLRLLYAQILARQRRFDRLVAVLAEFPVEQLLPAEQELLVSALCELELWQQAYETVLMALAAGTEQAATGARLWRRRGQLARRLHGVDWWSELGAASQQTRRWLPLIADAEYALLVSAGPSARRALRQLAYGRSVPERVRGAARHRLAELLARDGQVSQAAGLMARTAPGRHTARVWLQILKQALAGNHAQLAQLARWYAVLCRQKTAGRLRREVMSLGETLLRRCIEEDRPDLFDAVAAAADPILPPAAAAGIYIRLAEVAREAGCPRGVTERLANRLGMLTSDLEPATRRRCILESARLSVATGRYDRAAETVLSAVDPEELGPGELAELVLWLRRAGRLHDLEELQRLIEDRVTDSSVRVWTRLQLALALLGAGKLARAESLLRRNLQEGPSLATEDRPLLERTRLALAGVRLARGAASEAVALLADDVGSVQGGELAACRDFLYGMALYEMFCHARPGLGAGTGSRARGLYSARRAELYEELRVVLDRLLNDQADQLDSGLRAQAALALARAHYAMGRYGEALAALEAVEASAALRVELLLERANCYWKLGQRAKAEHCLRLIGQVGPEPADAASELRRGQTVWVARALDHYL